MYVDDPSLVFEGSDEQRLKLFAVVLLWLEIAGFPVARHKVDSGSGVDWIGGKIERIPQAIRVITPQTMAESTLQ